MGEIIKATAIIRNENYFDRDRLEWVGFDEETREKIFHAFKLFVAATARGNRRKRIMESRTYNVNDWGILGRLWYHPDTEEVEYCCGQLWESEMATLRDAFDYKKR